MNDLTLIRKNLFRKKLRAILLTLSILIAFLIFGVLGAFYSVWSSGGALAADNRLITVNRINFTVSMPYAYWNRVAALDGVETVSHASWFTMRSHSRTLVRDSASCAALLCILAASSQLALCMWKRHMTVVARSSRKRSRSSFAYCLAVVQYSMARPGGRFKMRECRAQAVYALARHSPGPHLRASASASFMQ